MTYVFLSSTTIAVGVLIGLTMIRFALRIRSGKVKHPQSVSAEQRGARVVHRWIRENEARK